LNRRGLLILGGAAVAWPLGARAQQKTMPVIGFLGITTAAIYASRIAAFRAGLGETGHVEGRNVAIEYRWAEGHYDRLPELAADLVGRKVDVIATAVDLAARAAKAATSGG
jgi:putative ABC transport system substrate-binding protein